MTTPGGTSWVLPRYKKPLRYYKRQIDWIFDDDMRAEEFLFGRMYQVWERGLYWVAADGRKIEIFPPTLVAFVMED